MFQRQDRSLPFAESKFSAQIFLVEPDRQSYCQLLANRCHLNRHHTYVQHLLKM